MTRKPYCRGGTGEVMEPTERFIQGWQRVIAQVTFQRMEGDTIKTGSWLESASHLPAVWQLIFGRDSRGSKMASPEIKKPHPGQSREAEPNSATCLETRVTIPGRNISLVILGLRIASQFFNFHLTGHRKSPNYKNLKFSEILRRTHLKCLPLASWEGVMKIYYNYLLK